MLSFKLAFSNKGLCPLEPFEDLILLYKVSKLPFKKNILLVFLSLSIFIEFKMLNNSEFVDFKMDWDNMIALTDKPLVADVTSIAVYIDLEYFNDQLINIKEMNKNKYISKGYNGE